MELLELPQLGGSFIVEKLPSKFHWTRSSSCQVSHQSIGIFSILSLLSFSVASAQFLFIFLCVIVHNFSPGLDVDGLLLKVCYRTLFKRFVCAARERLTACAVICHGHFYALGARIFKDVNVHPASPPQNREDMSDMASHVILPHGVVSSIRDPRLTIVQQGDQQLHLIYCHFGLARSQ